MKLVVSKRLTRPLAIFVTVSLAIASGSFVSAQTTPQSLKDVAIPKPDNLGEFIKDENAAIQLGKSLFWDEQVGSDGITSCATCHFHAGADNRSKNQISPGLLAQVKDTTFQIGSNPNYQLTLADFPFHQLSDPKDRDSAVVFTTNDVASSQGVFNTEFVDVVPGQPEDVAIVQPDPDGFQVNSVNVRRVEPRNTPSVINAVFNKLQFWDGRAKDIFNGVNISGNEDPDAFVIKAETPSQLEFTQIQLDNSSLASQAVGPPLSSFEMSAGGRTFEEIGDKFGDVKKPKKAGQKLARKLGKKIRSLRPLAQQVVAADDSVLGPESRFPDTGLKANTYEDLIRKAFRDEWWKSSNMIIRVDPDTGEPTIVEQPGGPVDTNEYTLMEYNFPLLFGLAVQEYEFTLVSDQTPFDKFQEGDTTALSEAQQRGLALFNNNGCNFCHTAPEFTRASARFSDGGVGFTGGFFGIGVTEPTDDPGSDGTGRFKSPGLRNVELTAPYMHNGGLATLEQVVEFYARGGNFGGLFILDGRPFLGGGLTDDLLNDANKRADLVAFLKALTDERVRLEKAPFDHPQLHVPNGHPGDENSVTDRGDGTATDEIAVIPAVGRNGRTTPPPNFLENPPNI